MTPTIEQVREKLAKSPEYVQEAIMSVETMKSIKTAGEKAHLTQTQINEIGDEVTQTLLGFKAYSQFQENITLRAQINTEQARTVFQEIDTAIFKPLKDQLETYWAQNQTEVTHISPEKLDAASILSEIEDPLPHKEIAVSSPTLPAIPSNLVDNKLSGLTRMPKEEITVSSQGNQASTAPKASPSPQPAVVPSTPLPEKKTYQGFDPYREQPK